jgi:hypothetical protein
MEGCDISSSATFLVFSKSLLSFPANPTSLPMALALDASAQSTPLSTNLTSTEQGIFNLWNFSVVTTMGSTKQSY